MSRRAEKLVRRWGDPVRLITETELLFPETAVAIAVLETGHFQSKHMMKTHNWFGFRANKRGFQYRVKNRYGEYKSAAMMLADYQAWESAVCAKYDLANEAQFRRWIIKYYAEDPAYETKLNNSITEVSRTWH